jgi:hypothetical protein
MWTLTFALEGAMIGFVVFNAAMGVEMMRKAYHALYKNRTSTPEANPKAEGAGHLLNYLIQVVTWTVGGGYLFGTNGNTKITVSFDRALFFIIVAVCFWNAWFSDTPWLRKACIYFMDKSIRRLEGQNNIEENQNLVEGEA